MDFPFAALNGLSDSQSESLDELDLRILDLFVLAKVVHIFLTNNRERDMIQQVHGHLRSHGMDEQTILQTNSQRRKQHVLSQMW